MSEVFDHYPRHAPACVINTGWRNPNNPQPGDWQHVCYPGTCPESLYYVSAKDAGSHWLMAGPYRTHAEALADVDRARNIADEHDGRAWFYAWGTCRMKDGTDRPGNLNKAGLI